MEKIKLFLKGLIIGCASILPGISGGTMALTLGIYEKLIEIAGNIFKNFKKNVLFLLPIAVGALAGIFLLSTFINVGLEKYPEITTLFFVGLMIGGIPSLLTKVKKSSFNFKNITISLISFAVVILFILTKEVSNEVSFASMNLTGYITLIFIGMLASATLVIPGISGSLVLMLIGYYKPIVNTISSLAKLNNIGSNLLILIPFAIGIVAGIVIISRIIGYLLKKYPTPTYYAIYGIIFASIVGVLIPLNAGLAVIMLFIGAFIAYRVGEWYAYGWYSCSGN